MSPSEIKRVLDDIDMRLDGVDNENASGALLILLELVERLNEENEKLKAENQRLRDENSLLKGEQGKPKIQGNTNKGKDVSSEKERKKREKNKAKKSKAKKHKIKIDRTETCKEEKGEFFLVCKLCQSPTLYKNS